jgi:hypothetical protein
MATFLFNIDDPRLTDRERDQLRKLSNELPKRDMVTVTRTPADPRALEAQHFKTDRGDL